MATTSVSKSAKATSWEKTQAAGGAAWAQKFIDGIRRDPEGYMLEGWVDDAERLFKNNSVERLAFYDALEKGFLPIMAKKHSNNETPSNDYEALSEILDRANNELYHLRALAAASAALIVDSERGELDDGLINATTLLIMLEEKSLKLAAAVDSARTTHLQGKGVAHG